MDTATESQPEFVIVDIQHDECDACDECVESARVHAKVTGSTGATEIREGSYGYHCATVKRAEKIEEQNR